MDVAGSGFYQNGEINFIDSMFKLYAKNMPSQVLEILDIGANMGQYSSTLIEVAKKYGTPLKVHLFEPLPEAFAHLQAQLGTKENVSFNNFAISESEGTATIFYDQETSPLASLHRRKVDQYNISLDQSQEIRLQRIDHYIQEKLIKHIHFCKIDVEGHELSVLRSFGDYLNDKFIDFIQFEYGETYFDAHVRLLEVYQLLESRNFKIAKVTPDGLILKPYYRYMENFVYANYVAISSQILELVS
ncbi:MAG: FkbM family methyltransferase [Bacteroidia bacterium]|nr:FkbM family methyltransferase [Bacteroidia bacterium]